MKRTIVVASAVSVVVGVSTILVAAGPSLAGSNTKTLKFVSVEIVSHGFDNTHFVGADKEKQNGNLVGTDSVSCVATATGKAFKCTVGAAFKGGLIYASFTEQSDGALSGTVTGGTRQFAGATGTVSGTPAGKNRENVTVTYHT